VICSSEATFFDSHVSQGLVSALDKLSEAKQCATKYVPKEFAGRHEFNRWIDEAIDLFKRRLAKAE